MQPLARDGLTTAQVYELLTGQGVTRGFGLELVDGNNVLIEDLSPDCAGFDVSHDNSAEVHGRLSATLVRELPWGRARVRAFRTLAKPSIGKARFNRGVFVLNTPDIDRSRFPVSYRVTGQDLTYLLDRQIGDTYSVVANGTLTYFTAIRGLLDAAGFSGVQLLIDGTRQGTVIPATRVWALTANPRWLDAINDLMQEISYTDIHSDESGRFRASPVVDVTTAPVEWRFDLADKAVDVVGNDRSETYDGWNAPNIWRFVRSRMTTTPVIDNGIYGVRNQSDGQSSIDSVGPRPAPMQTIDVADQAALVSEGDRLVAGDRRAERKFALRVDPLPIAGHMDVVEVIDGGMVHKVRVSSWDESGDGKGTWVLGGLPSDVRPRAESSATATITQATPLRVVVDGATVSSFANALDAATYSVGQRVQVTTRNPQPPLIRGVES